MSKPAPRWRNRIVAHDNVPPDQLLANPANWRIHPQPQQDALSGVIAEVGYVSPVLVQAGTDTVIDGHLRVRLALRDGEPTIPVTYVDVSDAEAALILATLDPLAAMAGTDAAQLAALLAEVRTDEAATQSLLDDLAKDNGIEIGAGGGLTDPDDVPEPPADPITKPGDLWRLGRHRLLCGDATNPQHVARLLGGERAACVFVDPPYGIGFRSGRPKAGNEKDAIVGDAAPGELAALLRAWVPLAWANLRDGGALWACCTAAGPTVVYPLVLTELARSFDIQDTVAWDKENWGTGWFFRRQWEAVIFATKGKLETWTAGHDQPNVVRYPRLTPRVGDHPTPKPVGLVADFVGWVTQPGDLVVDYFGGSGSTLLACEQTARRAALIEIEPKYVDQTVRRFEEFTGQTAELVRPEETT